MSEQTDPAQPLADFSPDFDYFVGIDSDGCVFDSMELKHKECFIPNIIKHWNLQPVSKFAREAAEFVNLYSAFRGINRWPGLVMVLDLLREWPAVTARNCEIASVEHLRAFTTCGLPHSNAGLTAYMDRVGAEPELQRGLAWSLAVNATVADMVTGLPPFPFVRDSIEQMRRSADLVVVSSTPGEALHREWNEHGIADSVRVIAGQEMGKKARHLELATAGKYAPGHVLMIGDAPGDLRAARANKAFFYPINPGAEDASWRRFHDEAFPKFLGGTFGGAYERDLIAHFEALLPSVPPWKK